MTQLTVLHSQSSRDDSTTDPAVRSLESRLEDGYARIEQARRRGEDVTAWENFWIGLLHQYERTMLDLPEAA